MQIRTANFEDFPRIVELWQDCGLIRPWNDPTADLQAALACPCSTVKALEDAAGLAGTVMAGYDGHRGWIYYLAVSPQAQGQGFGRKLLQAAETWLRSKGAAKLNLLVRGENAPVLQFYQNQGFTISDVVCLQKKL